MGKDLERKRNARGTPFRKLIGRIKEDAAVFLSSEEGRVLKKDIVQAALALGLVASLSVSSHGRGGHGGGHGHGSGRGHGSGHGSHGSHSSHVDVAHSDSAHTDYASQILHNDAGTSGHNSVHTDASHADVAHSNY
jgi:hypothetical protein